MTFSEVPGGPPPELVNPGAGASEEFGTKFLEVKPTRRIRNTPMSEAEIIAEATQGVGGRPDRVYSADERWHAEGETHKAAMQIPVPVTAVEPHSPEFVRRNTSRVLGRPDTWVDADESYFKKLVEHLLRSGIGYSLQNMDSQDELLDPMPADKRVYFQGLIDEIKAKIDSE